MEIGPTDEGMKNGHMAKDCPKRTDISTFNDAQNHWIHGPCDPGDKTLTDAEFNLLVEHKRGDHEDYEQYKCPVCRFEMQKWRDDQLTRFQVVEPQDEIPEAFIGQKNGR